MKNSTLICALLLGASITASAGDGQTFGNLTAKQEKTWSAVTTVQSTANIANKVCRTSDGNVVVTGYTNTATVQSQFIRKLGGDNLETEIWKKTIDGSIAITDVISDNEGGVFVAGNFAKEIDAEGNTLTGYGSTSDQAAAFFVHFDDKGNVAAARAIVPTINQDCVDIAASTSGAYYGNDVSCNVTNIVYDGKGNLYASLIFTDKISTTDGSKTLTGGSWYYDGYGIYSNKSFAVAKLNSSTLATEDFPIYATSKEGAKDKGYYYAEISSAKIALDGDKLYMALQGAHTFGDVYLNAFSEDAKTITFASSGYVVACADLASNTLGDNYKQFNAINSVGIQQALGSIELNGDNMIVTGYFNSQLPFDNAAATSGFYTTLFAASLKKTDLSLNWAATTGAVDGATTDGREYQTASAILGDKLYIAGYADERNASSLKIYANLLYTVSLADGTVNRLDASQYIGGMAASADGQSLYIASLPTTVYDVTFGLYGTDETGISTVSKTATAADTRIFTLGGTQVSSPVRGINIRGGKKFIQK